MTLESHFSVSGCCATKPIPGARDEAVSKTDKTCCRTYAFTKANSLLTKLI